MHPTSASKTLVLTLLATFLFTLGAVRPVRADEFVDRLNKSFSDIPADKRSDLVLFPLLAAGDPAPPILEAQEHAALLASFGPGWADCAAWAQKPGQTAILTALRTVTESDDLRTGFAFAQPYGIDGVPVDLVTKGMYTELGDPPMLAGAQHLYLPFLEQMGILAHVEASRLAADGKPDEAITLMSRWAQFCRQVADRPFVAEKSWAMWSLRLALERVADLTYQDSRSEKPQLTPEQLKITLNRLRAKDGFLAIDRIRIPDADLIAREQIVSRVMKPNGGPDPSTFAKTMARISSVDRPLRLFSATAYWDRARASSAGAQETARLVSGLRTDWNKRWELTPFDVILRQQSAYRTSVRREPRFAVLHSRAFDDFEALFSLRKAILAQSAGTRMALGVYAFSRAQRTFPPALSAVRPAYVASIDRDPYSSRPTDIQYFVPMRDTPKNPDGSERPHTLRIYPPPPRPSVELQLGKDQFIVYSVGPDDINGRCTEATQGRPGIPGDDLFWPPSLSLVRRYLIDSNQLH